jgi:hypothetical protein
MHIPAELELSSRVPCPPLAEGDGPVLRVKLRTHLAHLEHLLLFPLHPHLASAGGVGKVGCYAVHGKSYPPILRQIELGLRGMVDRAPCILDADQVQFFRAFCLFGPAT